MLALPPPRLPGRCPLWLRMGEDDLRGFSSPAAERLCERGRRGGRWRGGGAAAHGPWVPRPGTAGPAGPDSSRPGMCPPGSPSEEPSLAWSGARLCQPASGSISPPCCRIPSSPDPSNPAMPVPISERASR